MRRYIGLDVHCNFAQVAVVKDGVCSDEGRIGVTPEDLGEWAQTLTSQNEVALEATGKHAEKDSARHEPHGSHTVETTSNGRTPLAGICQPKSIINSEAPHVLKTGRQQGLA